MNGAHITVAALARKGTTRYVSKSLTYRQVAAGFEHTTGGARKFLLGVHSGVRCRALHRAVERGVRRDCTAVIGSGTYELPSGFRPSWTVWNQFDVVEFEQACCCHRQRLHGRLGGG